ncbi:hypothetical protein [Bacillus sp. Brlt_9]|uniref:hypothetical protein n=1 Tax=Bacillus sp. Brlt_9 TaxID=3110916 RepID=UPI003F7C7DD9
MNGIKILKNYINNSFICLIAIIIANFVVFNLSTSEAWTQYLNEKKEAVSDSTNLNNKGDDNKSKRNSYILSFNKELNINEIKKMKVEIVKFIEKSSNYDTEIKQIDTTNPYIFFRTNESIEKVKKSLDKYGEIQKLGNSTELF